MAKMKTGAKIGIFALTTCVVIASGFGICKFGFADKGKNPIDKIKEVITTTSPKENIKTFEVEKEKYYLAIEGKDTLKYTLETSTGENKIEFTSSDESIVSVDSNGKLVGKSKGTTTVKLTAYTVEKEVEVFRSIDELREKCAYYLTHEKERLTIAINGYKKVKDTLSYPHQLQKLIDILQEEHT